jgi:hypothetical protein
MNSNGALELLPAAQPAVTPMEMLSIAVSQNADIDKLTKLMELQERWEKNEARKAFNVAFSAFKSEAVTVVRATEVKQGPLTGTKYANLYDVVNAVVPALSKHGLSHSWKLTKDDKEWMEVTCTIRHEFGHFESVSMGAAPDAGPGRNAIQARGSAKNYLERYTLLAATGLAAGGQDNDANGGDHVPQEVVEEWLLAIREAQDMDSLKRVFGEAYSKAQIAGDMTAMRAYMVAKEDRKKIIQ